MSNIKFAWDRRKALTNFRKHHVSFEEAQTAFLDDNGRIINDPDHSADEDRFVLLGFSLSARCLIVSHCYRESGQLIRIISARPADKIEEANYWSFL